MRRRAPKGEWSAHTARLGVAERVADLGGRLVHVAEVPGSSTPVVALGGCGLSLDFWLPVGRELVARDPDARLIAYDRPGLGGTPWPGRVPTLAEEVATLTALLRTLDRPAVVVAHSQAAFHAEATARLHPELVAGLVMVDGSVEWPAEPPVDPNAGLAQAVSKLTAVRGTRVLGQLLWRLGTWLQSERTLDHLHGDRIARVYRSVDALSMATGEALGYDQQAWDLICVRADHPWPGLPTVVLTAAGGLGARRWRATQRRWARLLSASRVVVEDSKHLMMIDRPEVIADAVLGLIAWTASG